MNVEWNNVYWINIQLISHSETEGGGRKLVFEYWIQNRVGIYGVVVFFNKQISLSWSLSFLLLLESLKYEIAIHNVFSKFHFRDVTEQQNWNIKIVGAFYYSRDAAGNIFLIKIS